MSYKRFTFQNGVPRYENNSYVQNEGLYVQFNPYVVTDVNHPVAPAPPQGLSILLNESFGNGGCTLRQSTQMCSTVVTQKGLVCAAQGGTVNLSTGNVSKPCVR